MYLGQRLRVKKKDRDEARDRSESLVRQDGEAKGVLRYVRYRESNVM